jgi:hypothetical protein
MLTLVLTFAFSLSVTALAKEESETRSVTRISKGDLPTAVRKAFKREYPFGKIKDVSREMEDSVAYYRVESKDGGIDRDLLFTSTGVVKEIEETVSLKNLPTLLNESLDENYPKGNVKKVHKCLRGGVITYRVWMNNGGHKYILTMSGDGRVMETEQRTR